ncbi:hypothetical protein [Flavobacterium sp.]|jgi:hypothetical protein|uniref:hypothetical protein n=1 Tax=Flavobacterium sp. TaxID=239 RepID=UPI0037C05CBB
MISKILISALLVLISFQSAFSQNYVLAKPKSNSESITAFTTVDDNCESVIKKLELFKDSVFFVIDEIKCRSEFFFVLLIDKKTYFARDIQFSSLELVRKKIIELRNSSPSIEERISKATNQIIIFKDSVRILIEKHKTIQDSIGKSKADSLSIVELTKLDSINRALRITVDKVGPRRTIVKDWKFYNKSEYLTDIYDIRITAFNPFRKKIKYIEFTFQAFNPVGDPAIDFRYKTHLRTVRGVGPIEPLNFGIYEFESVYFTSTLEKIKLKSVKAIFFDGSISVIIDPVPFNFESNGVE